MFFTYFCPVGSVGGILAEYQRVDGILPRGVCALCTLEYAHMDLFSNIPLIFHGISIFHGILEFSIKV